MYIFLSAFLFIFAINVEKNSGNMIVKKIWFKSKATHSYIPKLSENIVSVQLLHGI